MMNNQTAANQLLETLRRAGWQEPREGTIKEKDLRIDVFRTPSWNTMEHASGVLIEHTPTGIRVSCQHHKSQLQNKADCMKALYAIVPEEFLQ